MLSTVYKLFQYLFLKNTPDDLIKTSDNFALPTLPLNSRKCISVYIENVSPKLQTFKELILPIKQRPQLINLTSVLTFKEISPGQRVHFWLEYRCIILGSSEETVIFSFEGFNIIRKFQFHGILDPMPMPTLTPTPTPTPTPRSSLGFNTSIATQNRIDTNYNCQNYLSTTLQASASRDLKKTIIPTLSNQKSSVILKGTSTLSRRVNNEVLTEQNVRRTRNHKGIPDYLWQSYYIDADKTNQIKKPAPPILSQPLRLNNYTKKFHMLLYLEEIQQNLGYKNYNEQNVSMEKDEKNQLLIMKIKNLAKKSPTLQLGDFIIVDNPWNQHPLEIEGYVNKIEKDSVHFRFRKMFFKKYGDELLNVEFFTSGATYRKCHSAIDKAFSELGPQILFPDGTVKPKKSQISTLVFLMQGMVIDNKNYWNRSQTDNINWFNKNLNCIQKKAVTNILNGTLRPSPYVIYGPPGTGKTMTLIETIKQIVYLIPNSKLLIATPSNTAADLITQRLLETTDTDKSIIRLVSSNQVNNDKIPISLKKYSATMKTSINLISEIDKSGFHHNCDSEYIKQHQIVIGTCIGVGTLGRMGFKNGYFTHVLIDEAGQCTEPEIMVPLSFIDISKGQIVISGDPLQLGPVVTSDLASEHGLSESYLERLLNCIPYKKDTISNGTENGGYDPQLVTRLIYNFRSIPKIVSLFSDMFYDGSLISKINTDTPEIGNYFKRIQSVLKLTENPGVVFYGIKGTSHKGIDVPSWYNPKEATALLDVLLGLYSKNIKPDDIGIVTPYTKQVEYLTKIIKDTNKKLPKIGSVEIFQGQERKIILMSTVRSQMGDGTSNQMGFVKSPKRINVAISRAEIIMIIFGDPHLLMHDPLWKNILLRIIDKHCYTGCRLINNF